MMPHPVFRKFLNPDAGPELLAELVKHLRPVNVLLSDRSLKKFDAMVELLKHDQELRQAMRAYFMKQFAGIDFKFTLTESGIIGEGGVVSELWKRVVYKILPVQPPKGSLDYLLVNIFYKPWDHHWVSLIPDDKWNSLLTLLDIAPFEESGDTNEQLLFAVQILAQRLCGTAMLADFLRMVPEQETLDSPFLLLQKEVDVFTGLMRNYQKRPDRSDASYRRLEELIDHCRNLLATAIANRDKYGISFRTTVRILTVNQQLERLWSILTFITSTKLERSLESVAFIKEIVRIHSRKNRIRQYLKQSTHLVAYQATQHTGKTGENYITSTRNGYNKMLRSAAGGGLVVAFLCVFKLLLADVHTSPFGHAMLYSLNYAFGFLLIYFLHFTLATKQPAMTAATLAKTLQGTKRTASDYKSFALLFTRLFRSQFIAFVGNVIVAFIFAIILAIIWQLIFGEQLLYNAKSEKMMRDIHPITSLAILHAGIAGVYLFVSGLLSGYYINRNIHHQISYRFRNHPVLRYIMSERWRNRIAEGYDRHIGGITGNFWFGVMLGTTASIGVFFGLPIDIRHITFSAGNFGLAFAGSGFNITTGQIVMSVIGIGLIGFMNFIVSFSLSLMVAMQSRQLDLRETIHMGIAVWKRFLEKPLAFFFPPFNEDEETTPPGEPEEEELVLSDESQ